MGVNHSRQDLQISDSEGEEEHEQSEDEEEEEEEEEEEAAKMVSSSSASKLLNKRSSLSSIGSPSLDELDARLKSLKLKYSNDSNRSNKAPTVDNAVKLYFFAGGNTPNAKWITAEKLTTYSFLKKRICSTLEQEDDEDNDDEGEEDGKGGALKEWILKVGTKVRARVGASLQMQFFDDQKRVDFVSGSGVWAMKFFTQEHYRDFVAGYQNCSFENLYGLDATDENKFKVFGKDFIGWVKPEAADDSLWEDAEETFERPLPSPPVRHGQNLTEVFEEAATGGIQSLALGALDNSFLVSDSGIEVVKNFSDGIHGKGMTVRFNGSGGRSNLGGESSFTTPKKALLMRAETNMLLMSPFSGGHPHSTGLHQLDIETGKVVTEWKFGKDGADVKMRDITNDSKGSQLDPSESTFLGLDDNALCRWDMRDRKGVVQQLATPVLHWDKGHQFSRGTNFQCFATTGDGSIVVGSLDGKIRLYSTTSMRMAKTCFPGLGSPITHVDVTYDGKWILGTTDAYLILICTLFTDKDGKTKTGFTGRMGNKIAAPRLLKLTPMHSHLAGKDSKLHRGQFSWVTENGKQERHLVATVGKFSVIWNFQQVKNSGHGCYQEQEGLKSCYCYRVVPKDESIVESRFMHDKFAVTNSPEAPLVVATPMKVSSFSISSSSTAAARR